MLSNTRTSWSMFHRWNVSLWLSVILPAQRSSWAWLNITIFYTLFELWFTIWITWDFCFLLNEDLAVLIESREVSAKVTGTHFLQVEWYCLHIQKNSAFLLVLTTFLLAEKYQIGGDFQCPFLLYFIHSDEVLLSAQKKLRNQVHFYPCPDLLVFKTKRIKWLPRPLSVLTARSRGFSNEEKAYRIWDFNI